MDEPAQDAVLHVFDLVSGSGFPPALRTLHTLFQGRTPMAVESAVLGHLMFEILDGSMPTAIIGTTQTRVMEDVAGDNLPYMSSVKDIGLKDHITEEGVFHVVNTTEGLVDRALYDAFGEDGLPMQSRLQPHMVQTVADATVSRVALLTAGSSPQVSVFNLGALKANYQYSDNGDVDGALDTAELSELHHLAELCGRNKLALHRPSQLQNAVAPCLTFDGIAHLGLYLGEEACGTPGHSSMVFRPRQGTETIDAQMVEQLIAPIIQGYEADGSAVFDSTFYNRASFDDLKESLLAYESFAEMISIVAEASRSANSQRIAAGCVVDILRDMLAEDVINKHKRIEKRRNGVGARWYMRQELDSLEKALDKLKSFWAGLKTHEEAMCDRLLYRASTASSAPTQSWTWSLGDGVPASSPAHNIPTLRADIIAILEELRCTISHTLMQDAKAGDWIAGGDLVISDRTSAATVLQLTFVTPVGSFDRTLAFSASVDHLYRVAFRGLKARHEVLQLASGDNVTLLPSRNAVSSRGIQSGARIIVPIADDEPVSMATSTASAAAARSSDLCLV
ncbi:hypothetical protein LTR85_003988 [Meristemomyces frigidus]|nr:hypothetical protein LTR85_003988 [Meristemomyces frigidus]